MTQRSFTLARIIYAICSWSAAACVGDTSEPQRTVQDAKFSALYAASQMPTPAQKGDPCERGILESDLFTLPLDGADVSFGALKPGQYVVSSTYLRLINSDAASEKFWEVMGPVFEDLSTRKGLAALSLGLSVECNTARTLSIWRDDVSMLAFVADSAHSAAVAASSQLSRGGSVVMHWTGDETQATWKVAAQKLAEYDGPIL
jgi:hypothetical protein